MARPLRIEYHNAWYHVTSRGNQRANIFRDDKDRNKFLQILRESAALFNIEVHGYVLMGNHFHFLLRTLDANLSRFMQRFNTTYITYYNLRHHRAGHLYQGRYKAILIEADEYLLELSRYIHLNPVRLEKYRNLPVEKKIGILGGYYWSSFLGYIRSRERDDFMRYDMVLAYMGGDDKLCRAAYRDFVLKGIALDLNNPLEKARANALLGTDNFVTWVSANILKQRELLVYDYSHLKEIKKAIPIKELAEAVAKEYGVKAEEISKSRSRHKEARQVLLDITYRTNFKIRSLKEMGQELGGVSGERINQVHKKVQIELKQNKQLEERVGKIMESIT